MIQAADDTRQFTVVSLNGLTLAALYFVVAMVAGSIAAETTAAALADDPAAQRRYLGVEPLAEG
jgi:hypothetical protein